MEIHLRQPYSFSLLGRRDNQEDARFPDRDIPDVESPVFVVCDGVGGAERGEVASRTVADAVGSEMSRRNPSRPFGAEDFVKVLEKIYAALGRVPGGIGSGMATTLTLVWIHSEGIFAAHIGDSRIYHIRPGVGILYQSKDHSLVNELVDAGKITPEEALHHPKRNVITRCLTPLKSGSRMEAATTYQITDPRRGDYIFMCTDGVLECLEEDRIVEILSSDLSDREKMNEIEAACAESCDNSTAYLIGIEDAKHGMREKYDAGENFKTGGIVTRPLTVNNQITIETERRRLNPIVFGISDLFKKLF